MAVAKHMYLSINMGDHGIIPQHNRSYIRSEDDSLHGGGRVAEPRMRTSILYDTTTKLPMLSTLDGLGL
jgi:hypothetical protein